MPGARDVNDGGERAEPTSDFIDDGSRVAGFLDLPDMDADGVTSAILDGFTQLDDDAVLTVYCRSVSADAISAFCEPRGLELVHSVLHGAGTTFVLKRSNG